MSKRKEYEGMRLYSPYFRAWIIVTFYLTDKLWRFRFETSGYGNTKQARGRSVWAHTPLSYYIKTFVRVKK